jgi:aminoglycoside phosphotransferase (APT) family kinase protein
LVGLEADGAVLVRIGEHAVFRLPGRIVARVARSAAYVDDARKEIAVANWLEAVAFPAVRAIDVRQPVEVDGRVVVFWESVNDRQEYGSVAEVAELVRRLHGLEVPEGLHLPSLDPFAKAEGRIAGAIALTEEDKSFLQTRLVELRQVYEELPWVLPVGVIHGDASIGNVIHDRSGSPIMLDLDGFSIGPREWDLSLTAIYFDSFGWHTRAEYDEFARIYGFDIMSWAGYPALRNIREFLMVTWLSQKASEGKKFADEVAKRIATLRTGTSRRSWLPY